MGQEIDAYSTEARRERVLQALHILMGDGIPSITEEKRAILKEYDELCDFGYGRMEVVVVAHRMEGVNSTKHKKRKDLIISPQTT